jgi:sigma-B regulation protein RsbU (phosphoserine phosphatase)
MPISPAELREVLRGDFVSLALCGLVLILGVLALAMTAMLGRRAAPLLWLAAFACLYGVRLLIRTDTFRFYADTSPATWDYAEAAITYTVPIPIVLFARSSFHTWRRFWTIGAAGLTVFAAYALTSDEILQEPFSAAAANNLIAIAFFVGLLAWILRPGLAPSHDVRAMRVGVVAVSLAAVADNLRGMGSVSFPGPELEPFGFTILIGCLAIIAVRRVLDDAERLVAINRELEIARRIQFSLLPQRMPRVSGLTIAARYKPMTAVAGDFYDFLELDAKRLGILIADVSGHGVPAALIASMVKVALAAQRDHADRPAAVLAGMNDALCGQLAGQYVTAAYLYIDTESRLIRYGAAGHPPMLRSLRAAGPVQEIVENGLILGFLEQQPYGEVEEALRADERFLLYTDGMIEASDANDDFLGIERLKEIVAAAAAGDADHLAETLVTTVDRWSGSTPGDDLTVVVVDWTDQM